MVTNGRSTWYLNADCTQMNAGSLPPLPNTGTVCASFAGGWCAEAKRLLRDGAPPSVCAVSASTKSTSLTTKSVTTKSLATSKSVTSVAPVPSAAMCVQSCTDKNAYVHVRDVSGQIVCAGPDLNTCTWFSDVSCAMLGSGSVAPVAGMGRRCTSYDGGWCAEAKRQLWDAKPQTACRPLTTPPLVSPWRCIQSCADRNRWVRVRDGGPGVGIQCSGPNLGRCTWFVDARCARMTTLGFPPYAGLGRRCTSFVGGWCQEAQSQIIKGAPQSVCPSVETDGDVGVALPQPPQGHPTPVEPWFDVHVQPPNYANQTLVNGNNFGMSPALDDNWQQLDQAIRACRKLGACRLTLEPGVYAIRRTVGIQLQNLQDFTLDGQGSTLLLSYDTIRSFTAIPISNCLRCEFLNLNVQWDWEKWRLGDLVRVLDVTSSVWTLEYQDWTYDASKVFAIKSLHLADPKAAFSMGTRGDQEWFGINTMKPTVRVVSPRVVQLVFPSAWRTPPPKGAYAILRYFTYETHCIRAQFVENVVFDNIHVWGCAGKAMVVNSGMSPIIIRNSQIAPDVDKKQWISATADGIFVAKAGALKIENVEITRNGDDCINFVRLSVWNTTQGLI